MRKIRVSSPASGVDTPSTASPWWTRRPLPLQVPGLRCPLLVSPDIVRWRMRTGDGCPPDGALTFRVPDDPGLLGLEFYQQWLAFSFQGGFYASNGGHGLVGR